MASQEPHEGDRVHCAVRLPHRGLTGRVLAYMGYDRTVPRPTLRRLSALGSVTVIIDLDRTTRQAGEGPPGPMTPSPVRGLGERPVAFEQDGREWSALVELTPHGARALFGGLPLRELANTTVGLADLIGLRAHRLAEQLAEAPDWSCRFRILDDQLATWMRDDPEPTPVHEAWRHLVASAGSTRISALAERIGWTRQHLHTRFAQQIGLPPKTVARIARFHEALRLVATPAPPPWTTIATTCGYADQSHLNRDLRALTGCTPTEMAALGNPRGEIYPGARLGIALARTSGLLRHPPRQPSDHDQFTLDTRTTDPTHR